MFLQGGDIFLPRRSARSFLHRASILLALKNATLDRNVHSLCMHPPLTPEHTFQTMRRRWPVVFLNRPESRQCLARTHLDRHLPIPAISKPWLDSVQTHAPGRV